MQYAPIALFTYNRADKTQRVIESLLQNEESKGSDLFVFSDGPKNEKAAEGVKQNREYLKSLTSNALTSNQFKSITIVEREKNWGLANSLIAGITELTEKYGRAIIVEDDLILSPYFLKFMNEGLEKYVDDDRISAISGFLNPVNCEVPETFFLRYFACWGWATWKRAWDLLNTDARDLLRQMRWRKSEFNIEGSGGFYDILYCQKIGLVDSWAVLFYASSFLANKLVLYPGRTLTVQNGIDGSGVHCGEEYSVFHKMTVSKSPIIVKDIDIVESSLMYNQYGEFYRILNHADSISFKFNKLKSFVRRILNLDSK